MADDYPDALTIEEKILATQLKKYHQLQEKRLQQVAENPTGNFIFKPVHEAFIRNDKPVRCMFGANKSGKTCLSMLEAVAHAIGKRMWLEQNDPDYLIDIPVPNQGRIVSTSYENGIKKVILPEFRKWCPPDLFRKYNEKESVIYLSNEGTVDAMSHKQDISDFAGPVRYWTGFDEEPPEDVWDECMARHFTTKLRMWLAMTPDPKKRLTWTRTRLFNDETGDVGIFNMKIWDNPVITRKDAERILNMYPDDERKVRETGCFPDAYGFIYSEFKNFMPPAGHVVEDMILDDAWDIYVGIDPHPSAPCAAIFLALDNQQRGIYFDEIYKHCVASELASAIHEKLRGRQAVRYVIDPLANTPDTIFRTTMKLELEKYGIRPIRIADRNFWDGITKVQQLLHPSPPLGQARRFVMRRCKRLIWEFTHYMKGGDDDDKPLDHSRFHMLDAVRYVEMDRPAYHGFRNRRTEYDDEDAEPRTRREMAMAGPMASTGY